MSFSSLVASGDANNANSAVRRMVAGELRAILMQITLSPFSVVSRSSSSVTSHVHFLLLPLSPALSYISSFYFFHRTQRPFRTRLCRLHDFGSATHARACAPVFYYRGPPTFLLSIFLFFPAATPRLTTLDRHVHDFRLPLVVVASFLPLLHIFI